MAMRRDSPMTDDTSPDVHLRWRPAVVILAPLLALVMPVRTARRLGHVSLGLAWLAHAAGVLLITFTAYLLTAWVDTPTDGGFAELFALFIKLIDDTHESFRTDRAEAWMALAAITLTSESSCILLAWLLMPWAARDERYQLTYRRTLARLWLVTSFAAGPIAIYAGVIILLQRWRDRWWDAHPASQWNWEALPWPLQHEELIIMPVWLATTAVCVPLLLWAVSAGRWRARCRWPAACEGCGYSLMGMRAEQTCPECGRPVADTLGEHVRPGSPLEDRGRGNSPGERLVIGLLACLILPIIRPTAFGRRLRLMSPTSAHRWFALFALSLGMAVILAGMVVFTVIENAFPSFDMDLGDVARQVFAVTMGCWIALFTVGPAIALGSASLVSTSARVFFKRNLMPIAAQGACYLSGVLIVWIGLIFAWVITMEVLSEIMQGMGHYYRFEEIMVLSFFGLHAVMLVLYLFLLGRITWAGAHANR